MASVSWLGLSWCEEPLGAFGAPAELVVGDGQTAKRSVAEHARAFPWLTIEVWDAQGAGRLEGGEVAIRYGTGGVDAVEAG